MNSPKRDPKMAPPELWEQQALLRWLQLQGIPYVAIPNGSRRTRWEAARAKAEGMVAGAPDLIVILPGGVTLWIEMKRRKGGRVSPSQRAFGAMLERNGHHWRVCYGWEEAREWIEEVRRGHA